MSQKRIQTSAAYAGCQEPISSLILNIGQERQFQTRSTFMLNAKPKSAKEHTPPYLPNADAPF